MNAMSPLASFLSFGDSFRNMLAGLGVTGRDKVEAHVPVMKVLSVHDLQTLYRSDWLSRKIVDIPAFDATRAWRSWHAERDQIEALEASEKKFGIQRKIMAAKKKARLYGGSSILLGVDNSGDWGQPLNIEKVKKDDLKFAHVVERWMMTPGPLIRDITSPWFGEPEYYQRSNTYTGPPPAGVTPVKGGMSGDLNKNPMMMIHPSRVIRFIGLDYPDMETAPDAWGDSVLQIVWDAIRDAGLVGQSIASLVARANVNVIRHPGLTEAMQTSAGTTRVTNRFAAANAAQSVINAVLLDKNEEWQQFAVNFSGMPPVLQMYLLIASAAADVPSTRLLSREPAGQNATGESDMRNYYDRLSAEQEVTDTPLISPLDEVLIRSTFGQRDPDIYYEWNPLWQLTPEQKADVILKKAQAFKIDRDAALVPDEALVIGRENQLIEDGVYPGLEAALDEVAMLEGDNVDPDEDEDDNSDSPANKEQVAQRTSDATLQSSGFSVSTTTSGAGGRRAKPTFRRPAPVRVPSVAQRGVFRRLGKKSRF